MLEYGYVMTCRGLMMEILESIDPSDYLSYEKYSEDLVTIARSIINIYRQTKSLDADQTFSLDGEQFETVIADAVNKLKD